uniref:Uncharacterized protein n=1 Tax=Siphoviridae sp. ctC4e1 TaxID=2825375 RepID=A0A8S5VI24_9CAUD|nr:MAG TPA: hypothetical protein [Siphoviridae sp. ctC4e1]
MFLDKILEVVFSWKIKAVKIAKTTKIENLHRQDSHKPPKTSRNTSETHGMTCSNAKTKNKHFTTGEAGKHQPTPKLESKTAIVKRDLLGGMARKNKKALFEKSASQN